MDHPSPIRVARNHVTAIDWTGQEPSLDQFDRCYNAFAERMVKEALYALEWAQKFPNHPHQPRFYSTDVFNKILVAGHLSCKWILQTRQIPAGKTKAVEMAARLFNKGKIRDVFGWWEELQARVDTIRAGFTWPERGGDQAIPVGSFVVHNTIGAKPDVIKSLVNIVADAERLISRVPKFKAVLYGPVNIVGKLTKGTTLAWYEPANDDVYVRNMAAKGFDDLHSVIHELGHRYWYKFMGKDEQRKVIALYHKATGFDGIVEIPKVGEELPVPVRGFDAPLTRIDDNRGGNYRIMFTDAHGKSGALSFDVVYEHTKLHAKIEKGLLPTRYASKTREEFFAECFAFYAMGKLKEPCRTLFEECL